MQSIPGCLPRVAFWLVPRLAEREKLRSIIIELAGRFSAPVFVPHVTVYSCWRTAQQRELTVMLALAGSFQPIAVSLLYQSLPASVHETLVREISC